MLPPRKGAWQEEGNGVEEEGEERRSPMKESKLKKYLENDGKVLR
jgi:hypothetical protein